MSRMMALKAIATLSVVAGLSLGIPAQAQALKAGEKFGDWTVGCEKPQGEATAERCFIFQNVVVRENRQQVLLIAVGLHGDEKQPATILTVPLGVYLPAGLTLAVPGAKPIRIVIETCTTKGCRGATALDEQVLDSMRQGDRAQVSLMDVRRRQINLPVSLKGFTKGFAAVQQQ